MNDEFETNHNQETVNEEDAARMLKIHIAKFRSLVSTGRINYSSQTHPHAKKAGLPIEDSPDNELWFYVEDVLQLKQELEDEKKAWE